MTQLELELTQSDVAVLNFSSYATEIPFLVVRIPCWIHESSE